MKDTLIIPWFRFERENVTQWRVPKVEAIEKRVQTTALRHCSLQHHYTVQSVTPARTSRVQQIFCQVPSSSEIVVFLALLAPYHNSKGPHGHLIHKIVLRF